MDPGNSTARPATEPAGVQGPAGPGLSPCQTPEHSIDCLHRLDVRKPSMDALLPKLHPARGFTAGRRLRRGRLHAAGGRACLLQREPAPGGDRRGALSDIICRLPAAEGCQPRPVAPLQRRGEAYGDGLPQRRGALQLHAPLRSLVCRGVHQLLLLRPVYRRQHCQGDGNHDGGGVQPRCAFVLRSNHLGGLLAGVQPGGRLPAQPRHSQKQGMGHSGGPCRSVLRRRYGKPGRGDSAWTGTIQSPGRQPAIWRIRFLA